MRGTAFYVKPLTRWTKAGLVSWENVQIDTPVFLTSEGRDGDSASLYFTFLGRWKCLHIRVRMYCRLRFDDESKSRIRMEIIYPRFDPCHAFFADPPIHTYLEYPPHKDVRDLANAILEATEQFTVPWGQHDNPNYLGTLPLKEEIHGDVVLYEKCVALTRRRAYKELVALIGRTENA